MRLDTLRWFVVVPLMASGVGIWQWLRPSRSDERVLDQVLTVDPAKAYQDMFDDTATAVYQIKVTNASVLPVRLVSAEAGCDCTTIDFSPCTLQPGQGRSIRVAYNVVSQIGELAPQRFVVAVECEDGQIVPVEGTIGGRRRRIIEIEPATLDFGSVCRGAPRRLEGVITLRGPMRGIQLSEAQIGDSPQLRFDVIRRFSSGPDEDLVRFSLTPMANVEEPLADSFALRCGHDSERAIMLPIKGEVVSPLELDPPRMFLGIVDGDWRGERTVRLRWRQGEGSSAPTFVEVHDLSWFSENWARGGLALAD